MAFAGVDNELRCVSYKPTVNEPRRVMKLEFGLDKRRQELDPCELRLRRDKLKCRVAVDYRGLICVSYKPTVNEPRRVMKLEFGLDKRRQELDPCELRLRRDKLKCRVAVDYSGLMFRARMKISVVKKRSVLLFLDGCHL
ncbi:hypothetical protein COOONC_13061 [Cooperia oncophora]